MAAAGPDPGTSPRARVRRSLLFSPGHEETMLRKALTLGADSVCLDLEDGVPPDAKDEARDVVRRVLDDHPPDARDPRGPEVLVRLNHLRGDRWREDVAAVLPARPDGLVVPKAQVPDHLSRLDAHLHDLEETQGIRPGSTPLLLLLETPRGVLHAEAVAHATPRTAALLFGAEDLAAEVGAVRTREGREVAVARSLVVLAAASAGVQAIDQVFVDLEDAAGLLAEAEDARRLGYGGKMAIHPGQLEPIHEAFTPSLDEARRAKRMLEAAREAGIEGGGAVRFEGRMLERPILEQAKRVVAVAEHAGVL